MLWYASGPVRELTGIASSAFSKGDLLVYTSASSLSRLPTSTNSVGALVNSIIGVAMADSLQSLNNQTPYIACTDQTVLWSDCTTGSQFSKGEKVDFEYTGGTFRVTTSAISPIAMIDPNGASDDVTDSARSRVRVILDSTFLWYRS